MRHTLLWAVVSALLVSACGDAVEAPESYAVFEVDVTGERFRIALTDATQIERAQALLTSGAANNIHGTVVRGNGGFNTPYSWHLDPESVTFPDLTMEICDGRPQSDVEGDVDYWVNTVKYYCPWGAQIVARIGGA